MENKSLLSEIHRMRQLAGLVNEIEESIIFELNQKENLDERLSLKGLVAATALGSNLFLGTPAVAQTTQAPTSQSQSPSKSESTQTPSVSAVVNTPTTNKDTLFKRAIYFFENTFKSNFEGSIQSQDIESGKIVGKFLVKGPKFVEDLSITMSVTCKDGKYKYEIYINKIIDHNLNINHFGNISKSDKGKSHIGTTFGIIGDDGKYKDAVFIKSDGEGSGTHYIGKSPVGMSEPFAMWKDEVRRSVQIKVESMKSFEDKTTANLIQNLFNTMTNSTNADW
jgi:hypothetical protein